MSNSNNQASTRKGQEYAQKAEAALREGKIEEAKTWHKNASNAFKEARDALLEGDTNTKMALKILIDYHRDREKNPGDPKHMHLRQNLEVAKQLADPTSAPLSTSSSTNSLPDAWNAVQEFGELIQSSATPPPLPESSSATKQPGMQNMEWKKGNQSVMAESYYFVGGETIPHVQSNTSLSGNGVVQASLSNQRSSSAMSAEKLHSQNRMLATENERLLKEVGQLRSMLLRERDEAKAQKDKFWKMFVLVKSAFEEAKPATSSTPTSTTHESELKALTRLLHAESEARKRAEAEVDELRRNFA